MHCASMLFWTLLDYFEDSCFEKEVSSEDHVCVIYSYLAFHCRVVQSLRVCIVASYPPATVITLIISTYGLIRILCDWQSLVTQKKTITFTC